MTKDKRRRTLVSSVVFSALGPVATGVALFMNTAATQFADFLRRSVELGVLIAALVVYLKLQNTSLPASKRARLQTLMYRYSGGVLFFSGVVLAGIFVLNLIRPEIPKGNVYLGLSVASLGLFFNGYFFIRYRLFHREARHAVMDSQGKIYQAKTIVDMNVMFALAAILIFPGSWTSYYIDIAGTGFIALYMMIHGTLIFLKKQRGQWPKM